ncbi:hypothetical protein [Geothrix sp. 21YS21S-2]|uniref:hypothetical protein n=1 Tax=Geothrix sp. 21YS21S-2 TaxID=3068893 RepID=UPI0027BABCBC|nr:hypothetical protein [Geothrix sp. 21YS21S-2]
MSTWHALATERLGTPDPSWISIFGPTASDVAALRTLDLTPNGMPMDAISQSMERDLLRASIGQVSISLADPDGSLATQLGPSSTILATSSRYAGPWITITEQWSTNSEVRFFGYLDETTIQWSEMDATTTFTVYASSQLLAERKLQDISSILRPYPSVPGAAASPLTVTTADAALHAVVSAYTPRSNALALEQALWAGGSLAGGAAVARENLDLGGHAVYYDPPAAPALTATIAGQTYAVASVSWDPSISASDSEGLLWRPFRYTFAGTPNLAGVLSVGSTITWNASEAELSHYVLAEDIPAPATGADGQAWVRFRAVGQLVAGDKLTVTYKDSNSRTASTEWTAIDVDGERNRVWLKDPLQNALTMANVIRIRRNSQDPVLVDGVSMLRKVVAPWSVDTSHLLPAITTAPCLTWLPLQATPDLYGATDIQPLDRAGKVRISRRGGTDGTGASPSAGVWEGTVDTSWSWIASSDAAITARQVGNLNQWPGGANSLFPPSLWIDGDLSSGATIPPNGWRRSARSSESITDQIPASIGLTWSGTALSWSSQAASGRVPTKVIHYSAQSLAPGRYTVTSGTWTFEAHSGAGTLGSGSTVTPTGLPTGSILQLGMGAYASSGTHQEAILGLWVSGSGPFTAASACLLSIASGGALTVRATSSLTTPQAGPWAIGGGLIMCTYPETLSGVVYPHTRLWLVDGGTVVTSDLSTVEIIPGTVQPLSIVAGRISGWVALGLESYQDDDGKVQRRARLIQLDGNLQVANGTPEPNPAAPLDKSVNFSRGSLIANPVPASGSILGRMVRTGQGDRCVGLLGGRLFLVDNLVSQVLERVSLSDLSSLDYMEQLGQALMATGVQLPDGSIAMVSRRSGTLRGSVSPAAEGNVTFCPVGIWTGQVEVGFQDQIAGTTETTVSLPAWTGGKVLQLDLSKVLSSPAQSQAIGDSMAAHWGVPAAARTATWVDPARGLQAAMAPPFWAAYQVGDRVPAAGRTWKLTQLNWSPELRSADVELLEIPGGGA